MFAKEEKKEVHYPVVSEKILNPGLPIIFFEKSHKLIRKSPIGTENPGLTQN